MIFGIHSLIILMIIDMSGSVPSCRWFRSLYNDEKE